MIAGAVAVRIGQEDALAGLLTDTALRITRLERAWRGPPSPESVCSVDTLAHLPDPQQSMFAWVIAEQEWYHVNVSNVWVTGQVPTGQ